MKKIIGIVEKVKLIGENEIETYALFDTGAKQTSIDTRLASEAKLGPVVKTTVIKNPSFKENIIRPVVMAKIEIDGDIYEAKVNIQDRSHMKFPILIGRDIIAGNFLVDPKKNRKFIKKVKSGMTLEEIKKTIEEE
jgi:hypothetical protein